MFLTLFFIAFYIYVEPAKFEPRVKLKFIIENLTSSIIYIIM